jgi:hypothetical protein
MVNPLSRKPEIKYEHGDPDYRCRELNSRKLTYMMDWFYFTKESTDHNGNIVKTIERIDLPSGTKGWILENSARVKGLIRKMTSGSPELVDEIYRRTVASAPTPIPWDKMKVI